jgi:hypothetical protein
VTSSVAGTGRGAAFTVFGIVSPGRVTGIRLVRTYLADDEDGLADERHHGLVVDAVEQALGIQVTLRLSRGPPWNSSPSAAGFEPDDQEARRSASSRAPGLPSVRSERGELVRLRCPVRRCAMTSDCGQQPRSSWQPTAGQCRTLPTVYGGGSSAFLRTQQTGSGQHKELPEGRALHECPR